MPTQPSRGAVGDRFGWRIHPITGTRRFHYGDDTLGEGNYAPVTGVVVFAGWDDSGMGFGYAVGIREAAAPSVIWWVAHHASLSVRVGDSVTERTTYLGPKGSTGASTGPHAHTERRVGGAARPGSGTATDPRAHYTTTAGGGSSQGDDMTPEESQKLNAIYDALFLTTPTSRGSSAGVLAVLGKLEARPVSAVTEADREALAAAAKSGVADAVAAIKFPTKVTLPEGTLS